MGNAGLSGSGLPWFAQHAHRDQPQPALPFQIPDFIKHAAQQHLAAQQVAQLKVNQLFVHTGNCNMKINSYEMSMRWQTIARPQFQKKSRNVNFRKAIHQMVKNDGVIMHHTLLNNGSKLVPFLSVSSFR